MNITRFGGLLLLVALGGAMVASITSDDPKTALIQIEQEWNQALKAKNSAWFEQHLAEDVTDVSSGNGALHTKADDIAALKTDTTTYETLELSELQVRLEGNIGVVTGVNHLAGHDDKGQPFDLRLRFTDTYIKRDGRWLIWATQHTRIK